VIDRDVLNASSPADANRDRRVDFADLLIVAQNYGQTGRTFSQGNFDYSFDGSVGFGDLLILAQNYNASLIRADDRPSTFPARQLTRGADFLGIDRNTLNKKVKDLDIEAVD
jgi:hypothetical protein